ncbi:GIY-YIG nuclease family protein [Flavobacterium sp.]|uniref:GIY-YIG nuclease family protein n=2 Tax=Flavobacterium sp. TaxID=239 RepID=UPI004047C287
MFGAFFVKIISMYFVYIIYSAKLDNYYVGTTDDVGRRLNEHNSKKYLNSFTCKGIPWELKLSYLCDKSETAYKLERFVKRMKSRSFILKIIEDEAILDGICKNKL